MKFPGIARSIIIFVVLTLANVRKADLSAFFYQGYSCGHGKLTVLVKMQQLVIQFPVKTSVGKQRRNLKIQQALLEEKAMKSYQENNHFTQSYG